MYRLESWGNPQLPIEIEDSIEAKNFKKQENFSVDNTSDVSATKASNGYLIYEANVRVNNIKNGNFRIFIDIYYMIFFNCARFLFILRLCHTLVHTLAQTRQTLPIGPASRKIKTIQI